MSDPTNVGSDESNVRLANTEAQRAAASALLLTGYGVDLLLHEQKSGAKVHFFVWPDRDEIRTSAGLVVHRDGTAFVHLPAGNRNKEAVAGLYSAIQKNAKSLQARVVLVLLPPNLHPFFDELSQHGFIHVSDVLTMECRDRQQVRTLGNLAPAPHSLDATAENDQRLARLIQSTYVESLSDPSLGPDHSSALFLERLQYEASDHRDRYVYRDGDKDAAVCLISRYEKPPHLVVRYLGVAPEFRGQKMGSRILAASLAASWTPEYRYAAVDVDQQNTYAVAVYEELGFRLRSRAVEFMLPLESQDAVFGSS